MAARPPARRPRVELPWVTRPDDYQVDPDDIWTARDTDTAVARYDAHSIFRATVQMGYSDLASRRVLSTHRSMPDSCPICDKLYRGHFKGDIQRVYGPVVQECCCMDCCRACSMSLCREKCVFCTELESDRRKFW